MPGSLRGRRRATEDGRLVTFGGRLAVLRDVAVDFARCAGRAGGEPLEAVGRLREVDELYRFHPGFLRLAGTRLPWRPWRRPRLRRFQLQDVLATLATDGAGAFPGPLAAGATPHLLVLRYEYANVFHVMTDWYNAFLVQRFLGLPSVRIVLADGHPAAPLDDGWCALFGLKPSQGRIPVDPFYLGRVAGPMTRTVDDSVLMMATLSRADWRDGMSRSSSPPNCARSHFKRSSCSAASIML